MTDLPSCELVQRFMHEAGFPVANPDDEMVFPAAKFMKLASRLIQHGADQELEACCKWLPKLPPWSADDLRTARRPKPPSLKKRALKILEEEPEADDMKELIVFDTDQVNIIRRALEQLDD